MTDMPPTVPPGGSYTPPPAVPPGGGYTPPPPPPPAGGSPNSNRTLMLVLSYLGLLALVPLITEKEDKEVQWHAKNGLALLVATVALGIVLWFGSVVLSMILPDMLRGCALSVVSCGLPIGYFALSLLCIMKATQGQRLRIPVISDFVDKM